MNRGRSPAGITGGSSGGDHRGKIIYIFAFAVTLPLCLSLPLPLCIFYSSLMIRQQKVTQKTIRQKSRRSSFIGRSMHECMIRQRNPRRHDDINRSNLLDVLAEARTTRLRQSNNSRWCESQYCPTFGAVDQFSHPAVIEAGQDVRLSTGQTSDHRRIAMSLDRRVCWDRDIRTTED